MQKEEKSQYLIACVQNANKEAPKHKKTEIKQTLFWLRKKQSGRMRYRLAQNIKNAEKEKKNNPKCDLSFTKKGHR